MTVQSPVAKIIRDMTDRHLDALQRSEGREIAVLHKRYEDDLAALVVTSASDADRFIEGIAEDLNHMFPRCMDWSLAIEQGSYEDVCHDNRVTIQRTMIADLAEARAEALETTKARYDALRAKAPATITARWAPILVQIFDDLTTRGPIKDKCIRSAIVADKALYGGGEDAR